MKQFRQYIFGILMLQLISSCSEPLPRPEATVIPQPADLVNTEGAFELNKSTRILINNESNDMNYISLQLIEYINKAFRIELKEPEYTVTAPQNSIFFKLDPSLHLGREAYRLTSTPANIVIEASSPNGLFYGMQTLIHLMPSALTQSQMIQIPSVQVKDKPRFVWRGLHLDVSRHFMPKEFILKYIDYMAMNKLNTFHWHLTDDQGWRIEILKYPLLTEKGARRRESLISHQAKPPIFDGTPHGGYYTQEDIKEIVNYASKRYITIVPEIALPGHTLAALAAYPEYGCTGGPYETATRWGLFDETLCPGKDTTYLFVSDILDEVAALFPGEYIHIGGSNNRKAIWKNCPDCQKRKISERLRNEEELQSYFLQQVEKKVQNLNKKLIAWEDGLQSGLSNSSALMAWRGAEGAVNVLRDRHFVVMAPADFCNLDQYQANPVNEPLTVGGYLPLEKIYNWEPVPEGITELERRFILGGQAMVWTEYMKSPEEVEYMLFPRIAAMAETLWSQPNEKDYKDFTIRINNEMKRYEGLGIRFRNPNPTASSH